MNISAVNDILSDFTSLFFPNCCPACDDVLAKGETLLCTKCLIELPRTQYHLERENSFFNKFKGRLPLASAMALFKFVKSGRVQHLLHALKYKNQPEIGVGLGRMYGNDLLSSHAGNFDLIIPVPLHRSKKRKRGYNQSELFGRGLGEVLNVGCSDSVVERAVSTETQTRKSKLNRWENVGEVFRLADPEKIANKKILLVDDVVTTGATLEACGNVIIKGGCTSLSIACIAAAQ